MEEEEEAVIILYLILAFINTYKYIVYQFYIGRTNRNLNTRFKEHRKDFRYAEGKSKFSEHVLKEGHEIKTIEETMSTIHLENLQLTGRWQYDGIM